MGYKRTDNNERLEKFKTYDYVSERNYELFEEFIRYLQADNNVGETRVYKYLTGFKTLFRKFIDVNLDEAEKDDFRRIIARIQSSDEYSAWTKHDFKVYIKKYYRTMHEHEFDRSPRVKKIHLDVQLFLYTLSFFFTSQRDYFRFDYSTFHFLDGFVVCLEDFGDSVSKVVMV